MTHNDLLLMPIHLFRLSPLYYHFGWFLLVIIATHFLKWAYDIVLHHLQDPDLNEMESVMWQAR